MQIGDVVIKGNPVGRNGLAIQLEICHFTDRPFRRRTLRFHKNESAIQKRDKFTDFIVSCG